MTLNGQNVSDIGTNRKRARDFLLVCHSNLGPNLHRFGDIAAFLCSWVRPYYTHFKGFQLDQIAHMLASPRAYRP